MTNVVRVFHDFVECGQHALFGRRIKCAGCFVENEDWRILEQRARNRQALTLAAGQRPAAFADIGIEAIRIAVDKIERLRARQRRRGSARGWRRVCRRAGFPRSCG